MPEYDVTITFRTRTARVNADDELDAEDIVKENIALDGIKSLIETVEVKEVQ